MQILAPELRRKMLPINYKRQHLNSSCKFVYKWAMSLMFPNASLSLVDSGWDFLS
jgi:hypothetical protein